MKNIKYFGYGANASADMMKAIIGRRPKGQPSHLKDHELCIQTWTEIPTDVRDVLKTHWNSNFRTYVARPKKGSVINAPLWEISEFERKIVSNWEFWYQPVKTQVIKSDGSQEVAETEIIDDPKIKKKVSGKNYPYFLNDKNRMLEVASKVRQNFLKRGGKDPFVQALTKKDE